MSRMLRLRPFPFAAHVAKIGASVALVASVALPGVALPGVARAQSPAPAQAGPASASPAMQALLRDIGVVEQKLIGLAEAIPEEDFDWRPGAGVRSVGEVMMHVAADNYFLPTVTGVDAPAATGIKSGDYPSVQAYESRPASKADAIQATRDSFAHLRAAMEGVDEASLGASMQVFGSDMTGFELWVMTTTHLHEHLGQMIAYARSNSVVPPWSQE